jgi:hypothetical protein
MRAQPNRLILLAPKYYWFSMLHPITSKKNLYALRYYASKLL